MDAEGELRAVIDQTFGEPLFSPERLRAWFGFWHAARTNPDLQRINHAVCTERRRYRHLLGCAARARGRSVDVPLAGNGLAALADGVWLELLVDSGELTPSDAAAVCNL